MQQPRSYPSMVWDEEQYMVQASVRVAYRIWGETGVKSRLVATQPGPRMLSFALRVGVRPGELSAGLMKRMADKGMHALLQAELNTSALDIRRDGGVYWFSFPNPRPFVLDAKDFENDGMSVSVGLDRQGGVVDVDFGQSPHLLVAGPTNMGKTNVGRLIAYHLARQNSPRAVRLVVFAAGMRGWQSVAMLPHCWGIVYHEDALPALTWLRDEGWRRKRGGSIPYDVVAICDDMKSFVDERPEVGDVIDEAARMWREGRIHLVVLAQGTTAEHLGGAAVGKNITRRLVGSVVDAGDAARMTGKKGTGAEDLLGTGEGVSVGDGPVRALTFAKVEDRDFDELAATCDHSLVEVPPWETGETARSGETGQAKGVILAPEGFRKAEGETVSPVAPVSPAEDPTEAEVKRLVRGGMGKVKVIEAVWQAKPGKGGAYVQASKEFDRIVDSMLRGLRDGGDV